MDSCHRHPARAGPRAAQAAADGGRSRSRSHVAWRWRCSLFAGPDALGRQRDRGRRPGGDDDQPRRTAPGRARGARTRSAARPVQRAVPKPEPGAPEAARPPAAKTPEMTLPSRVVKPKPGAKPVPERPAVKTAPDEATGRTPTTGPEERFGSAMAETGGYEFGSGLTSGRRRRHRRLPGRRQLLLPRLPDHDAPPDPVELESAAGGRGERGDEVHDRSGTAVSPTWRSKSGAGLPALDLTASGRIVMTRQLPPLPAQFPERR